MLQNHNLKKNVNFIYKPYEAMNPEVKYRLIERLIQTDDDELLTQVQEILESSELSEEEKQTLDKRMKKYQQGESKLYNWEDLKERIRNRV